MIARDSLALLQPVAAVFAAAGFLLGMGYFASLRGGLRRALTRRAWSLYWLSAAVRITAAALLFTFAARRGVPAFAATFAGFLVARHIALRAARRTA